MFQRLKGAIDSRIAEEQARQRALQSSPSRSSSIASTSRVRGASPAIKSRSNRPAANGNGEETTKGPDPKEFEPEISLDDEDALSGNVTPQPSSSRRGTGTEPEAKSDDPVEVHGASTASKAVGDGQTAQAAPELPTEVRLKLRKLERLESRYQELLRSYRIAHARVSSIDPFEASLREHTPLTSISNPGALVEYLSQIELRSTMSHEELKRVSQERDSLQQNLATAEKKARDAQDELTRSKAAHPTSQPGHHQMIDPEKQKSHVRNDEEAKGRSSLDSVKTESATKSPLLSGMSRSTFSLFSPKKQSTEDPQSSGEPEEFFSFDKEVPRLEGELDERQKLVDGLQAEVAALKHDLSVAQESTQSMAQSLETATREVNSLREQSERVDSELSSQKSRSEAEIYGLRSQLEAADSKMRQQESETRKEDEETVKNNEKLLSETQTELERLRETSVQHADATAKTAKLQEEVRSLENELVGLRAHKEQSDDSQSRLSSLKGLADKLSGDLAAANADRKSLEAQLKASSNTIAELKLQIQSCDDRTQAEPKVARAEDGQLEAQPGSTTAQNGQEAVSGKKKNKRKKKAPKMPEQTGGVASQQNGPQESAGMAQSTDTHSGSWKGENELRARNKELEDMLASKEEIITKLEAKLKDQDDLQEEIESLRDDLVNLGQEHVEVKDKLKRLEVEKSALETNLTDAVKESADLRASHASTNGKSKQKHGELTAQFEELTLKAADLQTDLTVAQQLASSRFKDLTDLRTILQKAQPEMASLREENSSLKALRDELEGKVSDLQKVEARHNLMRTEVGDLRRRVGEKDAEIKSLTQKLLQERTSKEKAEDSQVKTTQRLQRLENEKEQLNKTLEHHVADISRSKNEITELQKQLQSVQTSLSRAEQQNRSLNEDFQLKTAQHASAESLMASMRDQATEMAVQKKEAQERCDSLEEEVSDAHRLLGERSREAETMRRLLSEAESRADSRIREMKDRMDTAIEERDRVEDEASTTGRRRARDVEDLRNKLRDTEREMKRAEEEKEELEGAQKDWKRRREEVERRAETSAKEAEEARKAMSALRDALDESEKQARHLEREKSSLRRTVEDTQQRLERLQKTNKILADEARAVQAKAKATDSRIASPRTSMESEPLRSKTISPAPRGGSAAAAGTDGSTTPDTTFTEHLKNVLLKFLEQKDKKNQMQLVPVLGMLLHFDRSDEQKWMAAITAR